MIGEEFADSVYEEYERRQKYVDQLAKLSNGLSRKNVEYIVNKFIKRGRTRTGWATTPLFMRRDQGGFLNTYRVQTVEGMKQTVGYLIEHNYWLENRDGER